MKVKDLIEQLKKLDEEEEIIMRNDDVGEVDFEKIFVYRLLDFSGKRFNILSGHPLKWSGEEWADKK